MGTIAGPSLVEGYDVDRALSLLSPANFGRSAPQGCFDHLVILIKHIANVIFKIVNLICGDHLWYTNAMALQIVKHYFNNLPNPQIDRKIVQLYLALQERANGEVSYVEGIDLNAARARQQQFIDLQREELERAANERAREELRAEFTSGETGNLTLLEAAKHFIQDRDGLDDIPELLKHRDQRLKNYTFSLTNETLPPQTDAERAEVFKKHYQDLCEIYAPRAYSVKHSDRQAGVTCDPDPAYANAKDPYDLFRIALKAAMEELGYKASDLSTPYFRRSVEMKHACRLAVFKLLSQASVRTDRCDGPYVAFNEHLTAKYQSPNVIFEEDGTGFHMDPKVCFNRDIFSSTDIGCDPEGTRRLIAELEQSNELETFKEHLFDNLSIDHPAMSTARNLIDVMAGQIQERYSKKLLPMLMRDLKGQSDPELPELDEEIDFQTFTKDAETPYQYIFRSLLYVAQEFANSGLINDEDLYGGDAYDALKILICRKAAFEMLSEATIPHDFRIKLSEHVELECGKYYAYEPSLESPGVLSAKTRYVPNELCGIGSETDLASDPIKAKTLMKSMTPSEMEFFQRYIYADNQEKLYRLKGITDPALINLKSTVRAELQRMPLQRQRLILDAYAELSNLDLFIQEKYFVQMLPSITNTLQIQEGAAPTAISLIKKPGIDKLVAQDVLMQFVHGPSAADISIKERPIRETKTRYPVRWSQYPNNAYGAIEHQNETLPNPARCGNCMFGALSIEIFGQRAYRDIEYYATVLRRAAAEYMLANKDQFIFSMIEADDYLQGRNESEESIMRRLRPVLERKLEAWCHLLTNTLEWGTGRELEAIAGVFGVPIHVFYMAQPMRIGSAQDGIEEGVIQPNGIMGGRFTGAPIRMTFNGAHYQPIRLRT